MNQQPNATDIEKNVLSVLLTLGENMDRVIDILKPQSFYANNHQLIYDAMVSLYAENNPIDLLSVVNRLKQKGVLDKAGGVVYLTEISSSVSNYFNLEYHARIVQEHFLKRELIRIANATLSDAFDDTTDVFDIYARAISNAESVLGGALKFDVKSIGDVSRETIDESRRVVSTGVKSGVPTGFRNIDNLTNGWQKSDLIILAGRPSMGKSVCGLSFCLNPAIKENIPTAIFSLEMSKEQLVGRSQSNISHIESSRIIKKMLTLTEIDLLEQRCSLLDQAPVYIDDTPSLTLLELKSKARKLVRDKGVQLIVIDYLQLMNAEYKKGMNREQEVSQISRGLKALAKELNIPIIALSQLNRMVENRSDKRPNLSDLRESGSIEQDADMVIFTYRPEYYEIPSYEIGGETINTEGLMILIVAKHRAGTLGELRLGFNGELTKLENYDTFISNKKHSNEQPPIQPNKLATERISQTQEDVPF